MKQKIIIGVLVGIIVLVSGIGIVLHSKSDDGAGNSNDSGGETMEQIISDSANKNTENRDDITQKDGQGSNDETGKQENGQYQVIDQKDADKAGENVDFNELFEDSENGTAKNQKTKDKDTQQITKKQSNKNNDSRQATKKQGNKNNNSQQAMTKKIIDTKETTAGKYQFENENDEEGWEDFPDE